MQWLEDAMFMKNEEKKKRRTCGTLSSIPEGCFECGEKSHWVRNCPWKEIKCPKGCEGTRKLWTSRQDKSYGQKFLKCMTCGHFEWLKQCKSRKVNVRVKLEVDLYDICNDFESKFNYK